MRTQGEDAIYKQGERPQGTCGNLYTSVLDFSLQGWARVSLLRPLSVTGSSCHHFLLPSARWMRKAALSKAFHPRTSIVQVNLRSIWFQSVVVIFHQFTKNWIYHGIFKQNLFLLFLPHLVLLSLPRDFLLLQLPLYFTLFFYMYTDDFKVQWDKWLRLYQVCLLENDKLER